MKAHTNKNKLRPIKHRVHTHVRAALIPHKGNQFRPLLIRRYGLLAVLALVVGLQFTHNYAVTGSVLGHAAEVDTQQLLVDTNTQRTAHNATALTRSERLDAAAAQKAADMLQQQYWAHTAPDGTEPWHWFAQVGYDYSVAGENLAKNFGSSSATVQAWMNSPSHRDNLLDPAYKEVGFAVAEGELNNEPTTIIVALYGTPANVAVSGVGVVAPANAPIVGGALSPMTRMGIALQALNPMALASLLLMSFVGMIAMVAHTYRNQLPKNLRSNWYRHHGAIKASLMVIVLITTLYLYGGGQL